jgi:hypothetical protein
MNEDGHQCVDCGDTIYTPRPRNSGEIAGMRETLIRNGGYYFERDPRKILRAWFDCNGLYPDFVQERENARLKKDPLLISDNLFSQVA